MQLCHVITILQPSYLLDVSIFIVHFSYETGAAVVSPPPDISSPLHHYLLVSSHNGRFALPPLSPQRCRFARGMDEQGLDGFVGSRAAV
jgi:hypothetical protein